MKRVSFSLAVVVTVLTLGACSGPEYTTEEDRQPQEDGGVIISWEENVKVVHLTVGDLSVPCAVYDSAKAGGIDCMPELAESVTTRAQP